MVHKTLARRPLWCLLFLVLAALAWLPRASAEEVIEAWRSSLGALHSVSANPSDGSCWVTAGGTVMRLARDGTTVSQSSALQTPGAVCSNPMDNSCWVIYGAGLVGLGDVLHLAADGTELLRVERVSGRGPVALSVNPADGSCWLSCEFGVVHVAEDGALLWEAVGAFQNAPSISVNPADGSCWVAESEGGAVVHLAEDGAELTRADFGSFANPYAVSVNATDGSCWVALCDVQGEVVHLAQDGTELWRRGGFVLPHSVSVNPVDGSCWVADYSNEVVRLSEDGAELWRGTGFDNPKSVSVDPTDGSCWLIDETEFCTTYQDEVGRTLVRLADDGTELWRGGGRFGEVWAVAVDPTDGSCWVADTGNGQIVHLAEDGSELWRGADLTAMSLAVNPSDGSCWLADRDEAVHLSASGAELLRVQAVPSAGPVAVNPTDGSCWVLGHDQVVHLAEDGTGLWRGGSFCTYSGELPSAVSVNPVDGSCWLAAACSNEVVHLAEDGTELQRITGLVHPGGVSVDPTDGSCWAAAWTGVVHLADDGSELWRGPGPALSVSVDPVDGSCWVTGYHSGWVWHLAEDGTELWSGGDFGSATCVSVNPSDGSCWVADFVHRQVVHLVIVPFADIHPDHWAFDEIGACADAGIAGGYDDGLYHPDWTLSRDQMAVFISRSIATPTGEMSLADYVSPTTPSFTDVPTDFWCYKHIEYAVEHDIVGGYGDGTYEPHVTIDRGQMAVFIARAMAGDDASVPDPTGDPSFPDVPADFWSYRHIEYIAAEEVAGGYYDGLYHPEYPVARDQMAVFICRAFDLPT